MLRIWFCQSESKRASTQTHYINQLTTLADGYTLNVDDFETTKDNYINTPFIILTKQIIPVVSDLLTHFVISLWLFAALQDPAFQYMAVAMGSVLCKCQTK